MRYLRTKLGVDTTGVRIGVHQAGGETLLETEVVVGRERPLAAAGKAPVRRERETDEFIREKVQTEFLREAVTALEDWIESQSTPHLEVRHGGGSNHRLYLGGQRILTWYFAKQWMYFSLPDHTPDEEGLLRSGLSGPASIRPAGSGIRFHVSTDQDLDVVKKIILGRTNGSANHSRIEG